MASPNLVNVNAIKLQTIYGYDMEGVVVLSNNSGQGQPDLVQNDVVEFLITLNTIPSDLYEVFKVGTEEIDASGNVTNVEYSAKTYSVGFLPSDSRVLKMQPMYLQLYPTTPAKSVVISNSGYGSLSNLSLPSSTTNYIVTNNDCGTTLAAASCSCNISFTPTGEVSSSLYTLKASAFGSFTQNYVTGLALKNN